MMAKKHLKIFC